MKDRHEQAQKVLNRLHPPAEAAIEFVQIDAQMRIDKNLPSSYRDMIMKPSYRKRLLLGCGCMAFNQFSGILVITASDCEIHLSVNYADFSSHDRTIALKYTRPSAMVLHSN